VNAVVPVILGFLSQHPRSGYEIKRAVDRSTRFFWAASYGQIYPELRRLQEEGLVEGEADRNGGRRRTVYRITDAGLEALRAWLRAPAAGYELRDVGLLKLFFADALDDDEQLETVRRLRAERERVLHELEQLAAVRPGKAACGRLVLEYGIGFHTWQIEWLRDVERRLETPPPAVAREEVGG
jgi:PadR family transcriptional regulator AphA